MKNSAFLRKACSGKRSRRGKMSTRTAQQERDEQRQSRARFEAMKLATAQRYIHVFAGVASVVGFLFVVCDLLLIGKQSERLIACILRYSFSVLLILVALKLQRIRTFSAFSAVVSFIEACAILLSFSILQLYDMPNFMIQAMGVLLTILVVFIVPNRWENMLALALISSGAYFVYSYLHLPDIPMRDFLATILFAGLTITICAVKTIGTDRHVKREFDARTRLEQANARDFLTNAATRERLEEEARRWMSFCRRQGLPLCLVFADLDDLKRINDRFGHAMGDSALREVASVMRSQLRNSDTIARWGGDEFVLILPNVSLQNAVLLLDRVKNAVSQIRLESEITISCSFGVVQMGAQSDYAELLRAADAMMYRAKQGGKGSIHFTDQRDEMAAK